MHKSTPAPARNPSFGSTLHISNIIEATVLSALDKLQGKCLPAPRITVREHEAAELLGVDVDALRNDRKDARRGAVLKVPYCRWGARILYKVDDLREAVGKFPQVREGVLPQADGEVSA